MEHLDMEIRDVRTLYLGVVAVILDTRDTDVSCESFEVGFSAGLGSCSHPNAH